MKKKRAPYRSFKWTEDDSTYMREKRLIAAKKTNKIRATDVAFLPEGKKLPARRYRGK